MHKNTARSVVIRARDLVVPPPPPLPWGKRCGQSPLLGFCRLEISLSVTPGQSPVHHYQSPQASLLSTITNPPRPVSCPPLPIPPGQSPVYHYQSPQASLLSTITNPPRPVSCPPLPIPPGQSPVHHYQSPQASLLSTITNPPRPVSCPPLPITPGQSPVHHYQSPQASLLSTITNHPRPVSCPPLPIPPGQPTRHHNLCPKSSLPYSEDIFQIGSILHDLELCNALCVVHTNAEHLHLVSNEGGGGGREGTVETVIQEEEVQPAVVQDYGDMAMQEVGKQSIQGVGR